MVTSVDKNKAVEKTKEAIKKVNAQSESKKDSLFNLIKEEMNEFNFFILNENINTESGNVLGAINDTIRFLLARPIVEYDAPSSTFTLKEIHDANKLLNRLKNHLVLFRAFDKHKIKKESWGINTLSNTTVKIIVKLDPSTSAELITKFKNSVKDALIEGWKGKLVTITASKEESIVNPP